MDLFQSNNSQQVFLTTISKSELEEWLYKVVTTAIKSQKEEELLERFLNIDETCKLLGGNRPISKTTLSNWTKDGKIPSYRMGGKVFYKYKEIIGSLSQLKRYGRV